jgi:hypothetical protein
MSSFSPVGSIAWLSRKLRKASDLENQICQWSHKALVVERHTNQFTALDSTSLYHPLWRAYCRPCSPLSNIADSGPHWRPSSGEMDQLQETTVYRPNIRQTVDAKISESGLVEVQQTWRTQLDASQAMKDLAKNSIAQPETIVQIDHSERQRSTTLRAGPGLSRAFQGSSCGSLEKLVTTAVSSLATRDQTTAWILTTGRTLDASTVPCLLPRSL